MFVTIKHPKSSMVKIVVKLDDNTGEMLGDLWLDKKSPKGNWRRSVYQYDTFSKIALSLGFDENEARMQMEEEFEKAKKEESIL